jgi:putative Mg2+ transporter-C (MgtC) family protein
MDFQAFLTNISVASVLGLAIGLEREMRHHDVGMRTATLVCIGSALFVSLSRFLIPSNAPYVAAQVVSGIGFLVGGAIIREGFSVRGLNTAGTLWCTAAIGTLSGVGAISEASIGAVIVLALNSLMRQVSGRFDDWVKLYAKPEADYQLNVICHLDVEVAVRSELMAAIRDKSGFEIRALQGRANGQAEHRTIYATIHARSADDSFTERVVAQMLGRNGVVGAGWDRMDSR